MKFKNLIFKNLNPLVYFKKYALLVCPRIKIRENNSWTLSIKQHNSTWFCFYLIVMYSVNLMGTGSGLTTEYHIIITTSIELFPSFNPYGIRRKKQWSTLEISRVNILWFFCHSLISIKKYNRDNKKLI